MSDTYLSIRCIIPADLEDELPEMLAPWPVLGTEVGETSDRGVGVAVYLDGAEVEGADGVRCLLIAHGAEDVSRELLEATDWLAGFRDSVRPFEVGQRWWIDPHPDRPCAAPPGRLRLAIEPRMAFGTGSHESTQAILMALEDIAVNGRRVLDVGTGSGILALAAERSGADSVVALDIDETAIWVARETAAIQEWSPRVIYVLGPVDCLGGAEFDIVMCNMITTIFLPLVGEIRSRLAPSGISVFSGLLASEIESVSMALAKAGFAIRSHSILGEWASLVAVAARLP
ncbi:MAG: 50S ribosomal protein L11 methyltransferase [Thermoanaerobaculales bacterium]|jgi:ribosomal protein L11 methyltransferase|nr:50S ribosomal protein L11 methyltransferase [Thermoanaerobaculales bacterium]